MEGVRSIRELDEAAESISKEEENISSFLNKSQSLSKSIMFDVNSSIVFLVRLLEQIKKKKFDENIEKLFRLQEYILVTKKIP